VAIVDVTRAVFHPQELSGLRQVSEQRIVARILRVMGVIPSSRPGDLQSRAQDRAVEVDRCATQSERGNLIEHQTEVEPGERAYRASREALEPVHHASSRGDASELAEAREERIASDVLKVLEPTTADEKQSDHQHHQPLRSVVATLRTPFEGCADAPSELDAAQESRDDFETRVRRELLRAEFDA
jgi:hypothetical protein